MSNLLEILRDYGSQLSALGAAIAFIVGAYKYFSERKESHFWKEFDVYHKLVKELVEPNDAQGAMYVDRQAAIMFELRNFKRYYPLLKGLKVKWDAVPNQFPRLIEEINLTIEFLNSKSKEAD